MPRPKPKPTVPSVSAGAPLVTTYQSRISVLEAWQYVGNVTQAPVFIDRNWVGYFSGDETRGPSPVLLVPTPTTVVTVHPGDYVVRQLTTLADGLDPTETVEVWRKDEFERLFIPRRGSGTQLDQSRRVYPDMFPKKETADAGSGADRPDMDAGAPADAAP